MASRYWVGATTSWNTASNWSATSGGAGGAGVPTSADDVIFDGGGTGNCTLDVNFACAFLSVAAAYTGTINTSSYDGSIYGDISVAGTVNWAKGSGTLMLTGTADQDIDFNGLSCEDIDVDKSAGTVTLTGDLDTDSLTITEGEIDTAGYDLICGGCST
jgi:hypothetical protein